VLDENGDVAKTYGIRGVPTLILLDEEGRIIGGQRFIDQMLARMFEGLKRSEYKAERKG
jgi:predicted DsbA family dithiol-disulfide isomerase